MDDICDFLKSRNITDDIIQQMQQDKVIMKLINIIDCKKYASHMLKKICLKMS